jgi:enamine deaminase RidA (YjgF/YER057c/UK114 family)
MKKRNVRYQFMLHVSLFLLIVVAQGCNQAATQNKPADKQLEPTKAKAETPEYFSLRPEVEKQFGYTHAVKIGNDLKVSGAVSMDDKGNPTAKGDLAQQMKNPYADLDKVLKHYGYTFDDVVVENVFTTNMPEFLKQSGYRNEIYKKQFPTGSWLGVKELALPEFMIEIELEAHKASN